MTDQKDSAPAVGAEPGVAAPQVSTTATGGQPNSGGQDVDKLVSVLRDSLKTDIEAMVSRAVQSTKDRRFSDIEKTQQDILARIEAKVTQEGKPFQQAKQEAQLEDMYTYYDEMRRQQPVVPEKQPQGGGVDLAGLTTSIYEGLGIDPNDPSVNEIAGINAMNAAQAARAIAEHAARKIKNQASAADTAAPSGGSTEPHGLAAMDAEEIGAQILELNKNYRGNRERINELNAELKRRDSMK